MLRLLPVLILALAAACQSPDSAAIGSPDGSPTGRPIEVSLTEFAIEMEVSLMAGITTFIVSNDGSMEHNFALIGGALDTRFDESLAPGETLTLTTALEPGTYDIFCPVADHESQGMQLSIQVIGPEVP